MLHNTPPHLKRIPTPVALRCLLLGDALCFGLIPTVSAFRSFPARIIQLSEFSYIGPFMGIVSTNHQLAVLSSILLMTLGIALMAATWGTWYGSNGARRWLLLLLTIACLLPAVEWLLAMMNPTPYIALFSAGMLLVNVWYLRHPQTRAIFDFPNATSSEAPLQTRLVQRAQDILGVEEYEAWLRFMAGDARTSDDPLTLHACRKFDADPQVQALAASQLHEHA